MDFFEKFLKGLDQIGKEKIREAFAKGMEELVKQGVAGTKVASLEERSKALLSKERAAFLASGKVESKPLGQTAAWMKSFVQGKERKASAKRPLQLAVLGPEGDPLSFRYLSLEEVECFLQNAGEEWADFSFQLACGTQGFMLFYDACWCVQAHPTDSGEEIITMDITLAEAEQLAQGLAQGNLARWPQVEGGTPATAAEVVSFLNQHPEADNDDGEWD